MSAPVCQEAARLRRRGSADGRPAVNVLLLHGMGGGVSNWDALAGLLAPHLQLWDVRMPWSLTGDSGWARDPEVTQWVSGPVRQVREATGGGPDVIVAHSFAANVTLELLAEPGGLTTSAVLISPFFRGTRADLDWAAIIPSMESCYARIDHEIRTRRSEVRGTLAHRLIRLLGPDAPKRFYDVYRRTWHLDLAWLTTPLLLVAGGNDIEASFEGVRVLGQRVPHADVEVLDGCGHFPMLDRAAELAGLIDAFAGKVCGEATDVAQPRGNVPPPTTEAS